MRGQSCECHNHVTVSRPNYASTCLPPFRLKYYITLFLEMNLFFYYVRFDLCFFPGNEGFLSTVCRAPLFFFRFDFLGHFRWLSLRNIYGMKLSRASEVDMIFFVLFSGWVFYRSNRTPTLHA